MFSRKNKIVWVLIASAMISGSAVLGSSSALASTVPSAPPPLTSAQATASPMTTAQVSQSSAVASFVSSHTQPIVNSADPVVFAAQNKALLEYWESAPLTAWYGQWGCTISNVTYGMQVGGDGLSRATVSFGSMCPAGVDVTSIGSTITARSASAGTASAAVVQPDATIDKCSGLIDSGYHCYSGDTVYLTLINSYQYDGSGSVTGHVRLGIPGAGNTCAAGTYVADSGNQTLTYGAAVSLLTDWNEDTYWSNSFYYSTNAFRSRYCYTL